MPQQSAKVPNEFENSSEGFSMVLCWFFAANERGQMLPGFRTPGLILFDAIVLGETLAYVETILTSEPSLLLHGTS